MLRVECLLCFSIGMESRILGGGMYESVGLYSPFAVLILLAACRSNYHRVILSSFEGMIQ
jgi:hypothetical protein